MVACPYTAKVYNWYEPKWIEGPQRIGNPDVSLRMIGVVEKCSFCAHRLLRVREEADMEERAIGDGEYTPACAEICPAEAIYFGDIEGVIDKRHEGVASTVDCLYVFTEFRGEILV